MQGIVISGFTVVFFFSKNAPLRQKTMSLNHNLKKLSFVNGLLYTLLLTGCQHLAPLPSPPAATSYRSVEAHNFPVDYEQNLIGTLATLKTQPGDTLPDIARHFGLGHNDIISANPNVDPWLPAAGTRVLLPLMFTIPNVPRQGIVLNLANMRMFHFPAQQSNRIATYPVGIGRDGWDTPQGLTRIVSKTKNPTWNVPLSIQREHAKKGDPLPSSIPSGPNNPLGEYAMRLALGRYLIHGTNKPYGVGMQMSHGCLNLYPEDISALFNNTKVGTQVMIVDQPYLLGWHQDMLFLEAHKPLQTSKNFKRSLFNEIKKLEKKHNLAIDWPKVEQILQQVNGIPTPILARSMSFQEISANALPVTHPEHFYGQPIARPLTAESWSVTAATLTDNRTARKLAALLNHQGPSIPATIVDEGELSHVVAGPFSNRKEANTALKRIRIEFELKGKINSPQNSFARTLSVPTLTTAPPQLEAPVSQEAAFFENWFN